MYWESLVTARAIANALSEWTDIAFAEYSYYIGMSLSIRQPDKNSVKFLNILRTLWAKSKLRSIRIK